MGCLRHSSRERATHIQMLLVPYAALWGVIPDLCCLSSQLLTLC